MAERLVKTGWLVILSLAIVLGIACPMLSQSSISEGRTDSSSTGGAVDNLILVSFILQHERELK